jgi:hypothetical protein
VKHLLWLSAALLLLTATASSAQTFNEGEYYQIRNLNSGKCLDVRNLSVANGAALQQWDCNLAFPQRSQVWQVVAVGDGSFRIVSGGSAKCVDVPFASTANSVMMQQWECNLTWPQWGQVYTMVPGATSGYYFIRAVIPNASKCLDVQDFSTANGGNVDTYDCGPNFQSNQEWAFVDFAPRQPTTNIKYFGYLNANGPSSWSNASDHSNVVGINSGIVFDTGPVPGSIYLTDFSQIPAAAAAGLKVIVPLNFDVLLPKNPSGSLTASPSSCASPTPCYGGLRPDYATYWSSIKTAIGPYSGSVAMFYYDDEPVWNLMNKGFSMADAVSIITTTTAMIKADTATWNTIPIWVNEGWPPTYWGVQYPTSVDWVGFDDYDCENGCPPSHSGDPAYMTVHAQLMAHLQTNQKVVVVPNGALFRANSFGSVATTQAEQDYYTSMAEFYINLAESEPRVIGLFVFMGPSIQSAPPENNTFVGTWDMAESHAKWRFLMRALGL